MRTRGMLAAVMMAVLTGLVGVAHPATAQSLFVTVDYLKVAPAQEEAYLQLEQRMWKPIHEARAKVGSVRGWYLYRVLSPSGTLAEHNFVALTVSGSLPDLANPYPPELVSQVASAQGLRELTSKTLAVRDLVKSELWGELLSTPETLPARPAPFLNVDYMKVPAGGDGAYLEVEKLWKKIHEVRVKEGTLTNWGFYGRMLPDESGYSYNYATAGGYSHLRDIFRLDFAGPIQRANLGISTSEVFERAARARDLVRGEIWQLVDSVQAPPSHDVPMAADRWETVFGQMEFKEHKGTPAMVMTAEGGAKLKGLPFRNGTVELDIDPVGMGAGLAFRMQDLSALELVYFRPQANCATAPDCVQYAPFTRGVLLWDVFPQYQSSAPLHPEGWNHVKVVVSGRRMNVFVNDAPSPTLSVGNLEGDTQDGQLALIGPGAFANLKVTPDVVDGLVASAETDPSVSDQRLVRDWQLAPFSELPEGQEPTIADLPTPSSEWRGLSAERGGLINITRVYGLPVPRPKRSLTWLKTTLSSTKAQSKRVAIGWSREVWVFVNRQRVFADKNLYQPSSARKPPDGRLSLQNGSFVLPLKQGNNEVAVALANNFYGWGLILRLDDRDGIQPARP